ncbi:MAG: D-arabinono-1,4-lactone oxidase [Lysobacteraceae bacterium]
MGAPWRNWSGSIACRPQRFACPRDEEEVAALVRATGARGGVLRAVGAGHSSNDIVGCDDTLLSLRHFSGIVDADPRRREAMVGAGTTLQDLGCALYEHDLALPNYGDVSTQTIGGAIATGTHGSGRLQPNLSQMLAEVTLVDGQGRLRTITGAQAGALRAARVALGTLGVFLWMRLRLVPSFDVERREYAIATDAAIEQLPALVAGNRSFDFYWYPRRDDAKLRLVNPTGGGTTPRDARLLTRTGGYGHVVIPAHTHIPHRFEESEYALPAEAGVACFQAVRARVKARWRHIAGWRLLYRTLRADDAFLSPAHGRDTVTISLHQNSTLPWRAYFDDIEPVFLAHGGRPHWAKKHNQRAATLAARYPCWDAFARVRADFDPDGVLLTPYLRDLLGVPA